MRSFVFLSVYFHHQLRMKSFGMLASFTIFQYFLPLVCCISYDDTIHNKSLKNNSHELSPRMISHIRVHGILLWISMGFLMPIGILLIRISSGEESGSTRAKVFFYLHLIFQMLSVILATAGAVMSLRNFENLFNNNHQKIGLLLYIAIWIQAMIGFLRPHRGKRGRKVWYIMHWIFGSLISLFGIINIYTGLEGYYKRTSKSSSTLWTILFTTQVSLIAFLYLYQDKKQHLEKQGLTLPNLELAHVSPHPHNNNNNNIKELLPQPCGKKNALMNLFD
ncbi:cytochrome b561 domain-containing protein At4g18260 [Cannabis sativa]|uniref:cytochrome b561 domain-containing protein At4g18260 n=1 Tax=Cannabis sativa TaxID=3483 RepID=UPI0029C9E7FC|nr:cytochrome b561 domain-containing protein At4g18260 [Cannabis sativa]